MTFMPREIAEKLRSIGPVIDPPATAAIYAPLHEREPYRGVKVTRDVHYGPDPRQVLDAFEPEVSGGPRPVFIYVHGGGYVGGSKHEPGSPFYDNIMLWAARNGVVGVNMTYRLAPMHPWPAGAEDVAAAARWVHLYIARHGGDPARLFLCGHSAGATHAASFAAMPRFHEPYGSGLKGLILISGNYDPTIAKHAGTYVQYFGEDRSKYDERSPFSSLLETPLPILLAYAELEPPSLREQNERLEAALKRAKRDARFLKLAGHSHISIVHAINTSDTELSDAMLEFIRRAG
jgi:triacylglycerol lipase